MSPSRIAKGCLRPVAEQYGPPDNIHHAGAASNQMMSSILREAGATPTARWFNKTKNVHPCQGLGDSISSPIVFQFNLDALYHMQTL